MTKGLYKIFDHWAAYDNIWLISDTHFGENNFPIYQDIDSDERVAIINKYVHKKDALIVLGDVGNKEYIKKIHAAYKILICGNHDAGPTTYLDVFDEVYGGPVMINDKIMLSHEPINLPYFISIYGHDHADAMRCGINLCGNVTKFIPVRLKDIMESGILKQTDNIHRMTIDKQTARKKKRESKNG